MEGDDLHLGVLFAPNAPSPPRALLMPRQEHDMTSHGTQMPVGWWSARRSGDSPKTQDQLDLPRSIFHD